MPMSVVHAISYCVGCGDDLYITVGDVDDEYYFGNND